MELTYYGHGCFGLRTLGLDLLIDPFVSGNPLAHHIDPAKIPADYLLITHAHGDHTGDAETIGRRTGALIISNFEITSYYGEKGLAGHGMNIGGQSAFPFGTVKYVAAIHSSVFPDGTYGGNPGGFVVWNEEGCIYFSGDTALTMDMQLIPRTCPPLRCAVLPIGDNFTMGYQDATLAAGMLDCDTVVGCHYDSFDAIRIDHPKALEAFTVAGKTLLLPQIGESITL